MLIDDRVATSTPLNGKSEVRIFDDKMTGFGVRIRPGGRTWIYQYRFAGKAQTYTIGKVGSIKAAAARKIAARYVGQVANGIDPAAAKKAARLENLRAMKFKAVVDDYLADIKPPDEGEPTGSQVKPRTYAEIEASFANHWAPLNALAVNEIRLEKVAAHLTRIKNTRGAVTANRARAYLHRFFTWAMRRGIATSNPVSATERYVENPRDRVLADGELVEIWKACEEDAFGAIIKLLILTGQRAGEVAGMRRGEIDIDAGEWTIPGARAKNGVTHVVPLSDQAIAVLHHWLEGERDFLFGRLEAPFSGWTKSRRELDARILKRRRSTSEKAAPLPHWTPHDLRRTCATGLAADNIGTPDDIIERILNHKRKGVGAVYNRQRHEPEKRRALILWGEHVAALVKGRPPRVARPFRRSA